MIAERCAGALKTRAACGTQSHMTSRFTELVVDCKDLEAISSFWCAVLGYSVLEEADDYIEIGEAELSVARVLEGPPVPTIVFVRVPESKTAKVRIHIDVSPVDSTQEDEVNRLLGLDATLADVGQGQQRWVVMADPEGNEFCVLRSLRTSSGEVGIEDQLQLKPES